MSKRTKSEPDARNLCRVALPPVTRSSRHTKRLVASFRRRVEAELMAMYGEITPMAAKRVRTACKAMVRSMEVDRILAKGGLPDAAGSTLSHEQYQGYADRSIRYEEAADKALAALGLDNQRKVKDVWESIYNAKPAAADEPECPADEAGGESVTDATAAAGETAGAAGGEGG